MNLIRRNKRFTLKEVAEKLNATLVGDENLEVDNIAAIEKAEKNHLTFLHNKKYVKYLDTTNAGAVILDKNIYDTLKDKINTKLSVLITDNPYYAFREALFLFYDFVVPNFEEEKQKNLIIGENCIISKDAYIGHDVEIGNNSVIYPFVYIGNNVKIGKHVVIYPHVTILDYTVIGDNTIVQPGAVIGSDGFGFVPTPKGYIKIPQVGNVVIGNDVEIGSNTTIDRAALHSTYIGNGVKIDNLCQIAHNVEIGDHTAMAAQSGISGSTKIGRNVIIAGQVGFVGHIKVGDNAQIGAKSGVSKDIPANEVWTGYPARPLMETRRNEAMINKLENYVKKIKELEKRIEKLENERS